MRIEIRHLKYFIAVAEERHFGRAAERLNISQPPLSQQIMALENEVGARLLARTNRSVHLTQAGELFLKECYRIIEYLNLAAERAARVHSGELGELTIGFTSSAPFITLIANSLRAFRQSYPQVHLQMREINTKQQIDPLLDGKLDLGIMRNTSLPETLEHRVLLREPLVAIVPQDHPLAAAGNTRVTFRDLARQPFVFFAREVGTALHDEILALLKTADITPEITQEVGEAMTIVGLVSAGLGISILPASFARVRIDGVRYLSLDEENAFTEVWLVHHRKRPVSPQAAALISLLS
ncbi:LysR family transcriptional regulator [Enterobacillus tribolii]|uniref:DNA-binding transcriptional LysR family regulator n=1 Tax=Enterobacillus tribolii TaxID=1487935 RepID=A0A370R400_9GAMM|nr:LysR family transcriptional regulator [Enterobacillus tribolii]MBW7984409.1 LysR family transcriptional regulator [Enterobacillus tribolii]RDK97147.1 DNA-binding transcriptional LysR family regulator [Enterobacillus tribolii]